MLAHIGRHRRPGTPETIAALQFIGQQGKVQGLTVREHLRQENGDLLGPGLPMIASGGLRMKMPRIFQPLVPQHVKSGPSHLQALRSCRRIQMPGIELPQRFRHVARRQSMDQLSLFILLTYPWGRRPQTPGV